MVFDALPDGWRESTLGEIAVLGGGTTPSKSEPSYWSNATVLWATPSDITGLPEGVTRITVTDSAVNQRALSECSLPLNPPGTVLLTSRATIGFVAINDVPMATNQGFITLRAKDHVDSEFLLHWLSGNRHRLVAAAGGSTFKELSRSTARLLTLHLPPLDEQRQISKVLGSLNEAACAVEAEVKAAASLRSNLVDQWLSVWNRHAETRRLSHLVSRMDSGWSPACDGEPAAPGEWAVLKTSAVTWSGYNETENKRLPRELEPRVEAQVAAGDILITRAGQAYRTGVVSIVRETVGKRMISDKIVRLRARSELIRPRLLAAILSSRYVQDQLSPLKSGLTTLTNITQGMIGSVEVPLPEADEQSEADTLLNDLDGVVDHGKLTLTRLATMKVALQADLLSGRVRVPEVAIASIEVPDHTVSKEQIVQPAFKRAVFAAEVVHQLHNDARFGSVKHEKIVHLCELHVGLQGDLDRHAYKEAAGPYDPKARRSVEGILRKQQWFEAIKEEGKRVVYRPLAKCGGHAPFFQRYFGDRRADIQTIIDLIRPMTTQQAEIVATIYAVWNDAMIDGAKPTDAEIVASVLTDWHPSKAQIAEEKWLSALPWMRKRGLVPKGLGQKTRVSAT